MKSNKFLGSIQVLVLALFAMSMVAPQPAAGATYWVTNNSGDYVPGSLAYAVVNASAMGGTVMFSNVTGTITLTNFGLEVYGSVTIIGPGAGLLAISGDNRPRPVFKIRKFGTWPVVISGLTIRDGQSGVDWAGAGIYNEGNLTLANCVIRNNHTYLRSVPSIDPGPPGGGVANHGTLTMSNCLVMYNSTARGGTEEDGHHGGDGGGFYNDGTATLVDCTFQTNITGGGGDSIEYGYGGRGGHGGAIYNAGVLSLTRCTLSGNYCGWGGNGHHGFVPWYPTGGAGGWGGSGGAIYNAGTLLLTNCTIAGNTTGWGGLGAAGGNYTPDHYSGGNGGNGGAGGSGGGICTADSLMLYACTISGNATGQGGNGGAGGIGLPPGTNGIPGVAGSAGTGGGVHGGGAVFNCIAAQNAAAGGGPDVSGPFTSLGYNLIGNTNGSTGFGASGDILNVDPLLGPLADNGGLTYTMALLPGSPAIDVGAAGGVTTDQRGRVRPYDFAGIPSAADGSDIGAYEVTGTLHVPVIAWGLNSLGQAQVRLDATEVIALAAGVLHSLALRVEGTVVGWGENDFGQTQPPTGLTNVTAIAAGWGTSLALKRDGALAAWGWDGGYGLKSTAESLTNITAISACWDCLMALKRDGTVTVWGKSTHDETNVPVGLTGVTAIAGGGAHCLALKRDGTIVAWGDNSEGQSNVPAGLSGVVGIAAGGYHSMALRQDGKVVVWGKNATGQTNVPTDLADIVAISGGMAHSLALRSGGSIAAWGDNSSGQTNVPAQLTNVVAIAAGGYHNLALTGSRASWTKFNHIGCTSNQVHFTVAGLCGDVYQIMASTNMVDWQCLCTRTNVTGTVEFTDAESSAFSQRFYRIVMP